MTEWAAKRFWKTASVTELDTGFGVTLDGRPVKSPLKTPLVVPTHAMADAMAVEWDAQEEQIDPLSMPITRAVNATLDKVIPQRTEVADMLAEYGGSDLLCYRATHPDSLIARQKAAWDPLLDWAADTFGARLNTTHGVIPVAQPASATDALRAQVHALDPFHLTAFHEFVTISGSLVIGLAALKDAWSMEDLWQAARIDELWQEEQWGEDEEATASAEAKKTAFLQGAAFLALTRT